MDFRIDIENEKEVFTNGDHVFGKINIFCAQKIILSELAATLIGESISSLTGAPGLLFSRREEEKHIIIREEQTIFPVNNVTILQKARPLRLDVGCHSFNFQLRIPLIPDCSTSLSNSPFEAVYHREPPSKSLKLNKRLPPSTKVVQNGNEIRYRIDVVATTIRNMFKSRSLKSCPITIWPLDARLAQHDFEHAIRAAHVKARATILGPNSLPLPLCDRLEDVFGLAPAEILITAMFQPNFELVKLPIGNGRPSRSREVKMDLSVTKLNQHPQDLYLQSFQVLLVGYTDIRAGGTTHGHMSFWTLQSLSNIRSQVFSASDPPETHRVINPNLWDSVILDESVVPNFVACNLERRYELELLMGWQCRKGEHVGRVFFVQVRTPVQISSGVRPSEQVEKTSSSEPRNNAPSMLKRKEPGIPSNEESRKTFVGIEAPPTYDEAVRSAVNAGLGAFEKKNAGSW